VVTAKASLVWERAWLLRALADEKRSASQRIDGFALEACRHLGRVDEASPHTLYIM
jgi:hypothetical protein